MAGFCARCFPCCRRRTPGTNFLEQSASVSPTTVGDDQVRQSSSEGSNDGGRNSRSFDKQGSSKQGAQGKPFPKRPMGCKLSRAAWDKLEELFRKMDPDGSNAVSKDEARLFFKGAFGKMSADAMFNEVDVDGSGAIDAEEFVSFWVHVRKNGYKEKDILEELEELCEGGAWVDWKDGRDTTHSDLKFPSRPILCRLSGVAWNKAQALFEKIDKDNMHVITHEKANKHFQGAFAKVSVDAMFNEIDLNHHGQITAKEWMKFWVQVKASGYKQEDIIEELNNLMEGQQWVDWKDGRSTS